VLELRADDPSRFAAAHDALDGACTIGPDPATPGPLVLDRITPD